MGVPKSQLFSILPEGVYFDQHPFSELSNDSHPVFLEFNIQHDCWFFYILPSPNMHEFKIEIPYTMTINVSNAIYKPLVLSDKWVNTMGAKFFYGLPTYNAEFSGDNINNFNMINNEENISVKANFSYFGKEITNYNKTLYFEETYLSMNRRPWFTDETNFNANDPHCAANQYFWEKNAVLRYVNASIDLVWNVFNQTFQIPSQEKQMLGGIEVDVDLVISQRQKCYNFFIEKNKKDL